MDLSKTIDELDFKNKMMQLKTKAKEKEISDTEYEKMLRESY